MPAVVDGVPALAVVFEAPGTLPQLPVVGRQHSSFAAGRDDFVLAEGKRPGIAGGKTGQADD